MHPNGSIRVSKLFRSEVGMTYIFYSFFKQHVEGHVCWSTPTGNKPSTGRARKRFFSKSVAGSCFAQKIFSTVHVNLARVSRFRAYERACPMAVTQTKREQPCSSILFARPQQPFDLLYSGVGFFILIWLRPRYSNTTTDIKGHPCITNT